MKRVYCLYRVSTEHQVDKNDIPMQRQACHEFTQKKGWSIEKEFYEKGILASKYPQMIVTPFRISNVGQPERNLIFYWYLCSTDLAVAMTKRLLL